MNHLKMVTVKSINERLEHQCRLELAGVSQPDLSLGPAVILWTRTRAGRENWEVLPEWIANLGHAQGQVERTGRCCLNG